MRTDFHPEAAAELESSVEWYAERSPQAASSFCIAIEAALKKIERYPIRFPAVDVRHRDCVQGFPFQVVYRYIEDRTFIVAIAHAKRRPGYWRTR